LVGNTERKFHCKHFFFLGEFSPADDFILFFLIC
jgi:hypothetical protein